MPIKINNILPAFTNNLSNIKIPYSGSINNDELQYLTVKISEAWGQNNPVYAQTGNIVNENNVLTLSSSNTPGLIEGQYYRVELSNSINYGVIRYIPIPTTSLSINSGHVTFTYNNVLEPLLSVEFQLIDNTNDVILETSGDIYASYYQTNNYKTNVSYQFYNYFKNSNNNNEYIVKAKYITQHGYSNVLEENANNFNILQDLTNDNLPDNIEIVLDTKLLNSTGIVQVKINNKINRTNALSYKIYKQENINQTNIYSATMIKEGNLSNIETITYSDLNAPYGILINYIFVFNDMAYRRSLDSYIQYEDMFLSDRNNILKIKFNPKISNYKKFLQESKIDAIGNAYPLFSRNQIIQYKTFNIEGLIASDSEIDMLANYCFYDINNYNVKRNRENTPSNENMSQSITNDIDMSDPWVKERIYREKVFIWLNNGEPKLFKSPSEGNSIVRLLNVNLSPENTLGRKFYSFSCQAVELDALNTVNCQKYNLI